MLSGAIKSQLTAKQKELEMALSNNYKDNAKMALRELYDLLKRFQEEGSMKEKDYSKWKVIADGYANKMQGYGHNNHIGW